MWTGEQQWLAESAVVSVQGNLLRAKGTQFGVDPVPYRLDYEVVTYPSWITERVTATAQGDGWTRSLDLRHDGVGGWECSTRHEGEVNLPDPGGNVADLVDALDCDLGRCPLTNTMPVRRHDLHNSPGAQSFTMAWISVPDLRVRAARQRYEHVRRDERGAVVRYVGEHRGFVGELEVDSDAFVVRYPTLAKRIG